jgi:hypothetical protein
MNGGSTTELSELLSATSAADVIPNDPYATNGTSWIWSLWSWSFLAWFLIALFAICSGMIAYDDEMAVYNSARTARANVANRKQNKLIKCMQIASSSSYQSIYSHHEK